MSAFSLLIANYNQGACLADAWASVEKQSFSDFEVIVVDDGSTDDSALRWEQIARQDARIRLIRFPENRGVGAAKRACVDAAQGDVCGFLDPDHALVPDSIRRSLVAHADHPKASIVYTDLRMCDEKLRPTGRIFARVLPDDQGLLEAGGSLTHFVTFKHQAYQRTEGINTFFAKAVDVDMYLKLEEIGSIVHVPDPLYFYRNHPAGISQGRYNEYEAALWVLIAQADACRRRGVGLATTIQQFAQREIDASVSLSLSGRLCRFVRDRLSSIMNVSKS